MFTHGLHQHHVAPNGLRPASFFRQPMLLTEHCLEAALISADLPAPQTAPQPRGQEPGEEVACTMLGR